MGECALGTEHEHRCRHARRQCRGVCPRIWCESRQRWRGREDAPRWSRLHRHVTQDTMRDREAPGRQTRSPLWKCSRTEYVDMTGRWAVASLSSLQQHHELRMCASLCRHPVDLGLDFDMTQVLKDT